MGDTGLFGPASTTWRVNGETVMILGGGAALILQVAHPQVGAGVEHYSSYEADRWGRLTHTLDTMGKILFGDTPTAERAARRMRLAHRQVLGTVSHGRAAGQSYDATDPALILWVWATLVHTSMTVYQQYVQRLPQTEIDRYYQEQKRFAHACGVPFDRCPPDYDAFERYYERTVDETLEATVAAHRVSAMVFNPLNLRGARPLLELVALPTVGLLPPRLRDDLGLPWSARRQRALALGTIAVRHIVPLLPERLRRVRSARQATLRLREAAADA